MAGALWRGLVDCADVIRARLNFDADFFKFYHVTAEGNNQAFAHMGKVLQEIKCLAFDQGTFHYLRNYEVLASYENEECYKTTKALIDSGRYPLLKKLYNNGELFNAENLPEELIHYPDFESLRIQALKLFPNLAEEECTEGELLLAILCRYEKLAPSNLLTAECHQLICQLIRFHIETNDHPILLRGITNPDSYEKKLDDNGNPRTKAAMELKKTSRNWLKDFLMQENENNNNDTNANNEHINENNSDANNNNSPSDSLVSQRKINEFISARCEEALDQNKIGNPKRSCIAWLPGMQQFTNSAYAIISPDWDRIGLISPSNKVTGMGKKHDAKLPDLHLLKQSKINKVQYLREITWKGGVTYSATPTVHTHTNEILYQVTDYNMIVFTSDPCPANRLSLQNKSYFKPHRLLPELEALFLQFEYEKVYKKKLPLLSRSAMSDEHQFIGYFTDQEILNKWRTVIADFLPHQFVRSASDLGCHLNPTDILKAISNWHLVDLYKNASLMSNYPLHLQESIKLIAKEEIEKFTQYVIKKINHLKPARDFVNNFYKFFLSVDLAQLNAETIENLRSTIFDQIENFEIADVINSDSFDKCNPHSCHYLFSLLASEFSNMLLFKCLMQSKVFALTALQAHLNLSDAKLMRLRGIPFKESVFYALEEQLQIALETNDDSASLSEKAESIAQYLVFLICYCEKFTLLNNDLIRQKLLQSIERALIFLFSNINNFVGSPFDSFMPPSNFINKAYSLGLLSTNFQRLYLQRIELLESYDLESDELSEIVSIFKTFQRNLEDTTCDTKLIGFIINFIKPESISSLLKTLFKEHPEFLTHQEVNIKILESIMKYCDNNAMDGEDIEDVKTELSVLLTRFEGLLHPHGAFSLKQRVRIQNHLDSLCFDCTVDEVLADNSHPTFFPSLQGMTTDDQGEEKNPDINSTYASKL